MDGEEDEGVSTTESNVVPVSCPSNQSTFATPLEVVFQSAAPSGANDVVTSKSFELAEEGSPSPSTPLGDDEQLGLTTVMKNVYNELAEQTCDSYFRRIQSISLLKRRRRMQQHADNSTSTNGGMIYQYKVIGTCRNCPVSPSGSMVLFDAGFRRQLSQEQSRKLSFSGETETTSNTDDCQCVEGQLPDKPKAPRSSDFLEATSVEFNMLRQLQLSNDNSDTPNKLPFENLELVKVSQEEDDTTDSSSSSESNAFKSGAAHGINSHRGDIARRLFLLVPAVTVVCLAL